MFAIETYTVIIDTSDGKRNIIKGITEDDADALYNQIALDDPENRYELVICIGRNTQTHQHEITKFWGFGSRCKCKLILSRYITKKIKNKNKIHIQDHLQNNVQIKSIG